MRKRPIAQEIEGAQPVFCKDFFYTSNGLTRWSMHGQGIKISSSLYRRMNHNKIRHKKLFFLILLKFQKGQYFLCNGLGDAIRMQYDP